MTPFVLDVTEEGLRPVSQRREPQAQLVDIRYSGMAASMAHTVRMPDGRVLKRLDDTEPTVTVLWPGLEVSGGKLDPMTMRRIQNARRGRI